ncbi:5-formyltetrahydrofolate cyclo-ligase [Paenibacillus lautus]|uniref:5-formyltetrahydrofolate cyclo-ligase n=1 Tax=Paenibacillus lautus TaxID=1401 RepID=UPI002DB66C8D|nr:5-formyltetrahydrofolate cyclo-ligase [Paenibacillus lautus]MEC0310004.1 5-formyltetrahydrofolate cyclo-ligase [Paenibacillus lautus]
MLNPEEDLKRVSAKAALRKAMALRRDELSEEERAKRSQQACEFASEVMNRFQLQSMMIYVPFRSELDSRPLVESAWKQGIQVIVPRSLPQDRSMELYKLQAWNELIPGGYGIPEPDPLRSEKWNHPGPDIIWVPGLAFDRKGGRLGYGGGYYDRLSDRLNQGAQDNSRQIVKPLWVGIGYEVQVLEHVPMEEHDRVLDGLVTELGHTVKAGTAAEG